MDPGATISDDARQWNDKTSLAPAASPQRSKKLLATVEKLVERIAFYADVQTLHFKPSLSLHPKSVSSGTAA